MSQDELRQLKALYVATALYFDQRLPDQVLALYCEDLADLPFTSVAKAIGDARRDPKTTRCPLPSVIRTRLQPESDPESEAILIASNIVGAVSRVGPYNTAAAHRSLGPVAWQVVQMEGGWESVCQNLTYENMGMLKAQWRNLAKVLIQRGSRSEAPALEHKSETPLALVQQIFKEMPK